MSRPCRRDNWVGRVLRTPSLTHGTRLFLAHVLAGHMDCDGFVSRPRKHLAEEAGISERQAARYVEKATATGWLVLVAGGFKSRAAEYQATFPSEQRVSYRCTQTEPKGDANVHPLRGTNVTPFARSKGDASRHTTSREPSRPALGFRSCLTRSHRTLCRTRVGKVEWQRPRDCSPPRLKDSQVAQSQQLDPITACRWLTGQPPYAYGQTTPANERTTA